MKLALIAGADILLMPVNIYSPEDMHRVEVIIDVLAQHAKDYPQLRQQIQDAATRVVALKLSTPITPYARDSLQVAQTLIGSESHHAVERQLAEKAVTLIVNEGVLPWNLQPRQRLLLVSDTLKRNQLMEDELQKIRQQLSVDITVDSIKLDLNGDSLPVDLAKKISESDLILMLTYNLHREHSAAQQIVNLGNRLQHPVVVISGDTPYDIAWLQGVKANIDIYAVTGFDDDILLRRNLLQANLRAGIRSLFVNPEGEHLFMSPQGQLPVSISTPEGHPLYPFGYHIRYQ